MRRDYPDWLRRQGYDERTIATQISRVVRVEGHYGDLDACFEADKCRSLIDALAYSTEDQRRGRSNPSKIPFVGDIRNNLASYKSSVLWYVRFREGDGRADPERPTNAETDPFAPRARERLDEARRPRVGARTLADFDLDGRAALEALVEASHYRTIVQAIASLTLFSHPSTVRQTGGRAIFPSMRDQRRVGQRDLHHDGRRVLLDDNKSPTDAFLWANGLTRRRRDVQFNHVYAASRDPDSYTALPNICMTPAFIAKLTDTSAPVRALLRFRSHQLYGWTPKGVETPTRPEEYESLEWAAPLTPVADVRTAIETAMATKPKDRTVVAARELGWLFGVVPDAGTDAL